MSFRLKVSAVIAAFLTLVACKDEQTQQGAAAASAVPEVQAIKAEPREIPLSFEYAARVQGSKETEVRARVGGILIKRNYVEGSKVKEGDVLFQIDPEPFEVELLQAKAELSQNEANLKAAETQWDRISKLFKERIVSEKSRDEARANLDALRASTALADAKVKSAQLNLNYTTVRAPISGITSMETQSEGSLIAVNTPMTTITQLDPAYVIFSASENEIFKLGSMIEQGLIVNPRHSKTVYAKVKYGNGAVYGYDGEINFVNPSIDETTGTLKLRAVFPNPENKLVPGQFVRLILEGLIRKDAIVVPQEAVMQSPNGSIVYRINSQGIVEAVPVEVGLTTPEGDWIIDKGLSSGDVVIVNGIMKVRPGAPAKADIKEQALPSVPVEKPAADTKPSAMDDVRSYISERASASAASNDDLPVETAPVQSEADIYAVPAAGTASETSPKSDDAVAPAKADSSSRSNDGKIAGTQSQEEPSESGVILLREENQTPPADNVIILKEDTLSKAEKNGGAAATSARTEVYTDKVISQTEQNMLIAG